MIKIIIDLFWLAIIASGIVFFGIVVVGMCVALRPWGWLLERYAKKKKLLCFSCADKLERQEMFKIIYHRKPGHYTCTECKTYFCVEREILPTASC